MAQSNLPRALQWLLAIASGVLTFLAFPAWNIHIFAWFCAVPLLVAARQATPAQGFRLGLLAGTVTNAGGFAWMTEMLREFGHLPAVVTWAILGLQAVTQGLTMAVGVAVWRWLVRRGAPEAPSAWAGLWLGEAVVPMIFPWFLGNALSPELPFIQIADLGGVHLVSALVWAVNAALLVPVAAVLERRRPPLRFVAAVAVAVALTYGYGRLRIAQVDAQQAAAPKAKIGMVEGNVGIWEKEARHLDPRQRALTLRHNLLKHQFMTADLQRQGAELVLWPESAYMPYGTLPVVHALDRFLAVGGGGTVLRLDGPQWRAETPDRLGLPRDLGLLQGLSSPRADLWRAIDQGRRVLTVGPGGARVRQLPEGELAVATASPPMDALGKVADGYVVARSGRVWQSGWPLAGKATTAVTADADGALREVPSRLTGPLDLTSAACNGQGHCVAVGRRGAIVAIGDQVRAVSAQGPSDLWSVAGDPGGSLLIAAGSGGTVLIGDGGAWQTERQGASMWLAAWTCPQGEAWVGGEGGRIHRRDRDGGWHDEGRVDSDVLAGACDADGIPLAIGRGGQAWLQQGKQWQPVGGAARSETTAVVGFQALPSLTFPRGARRILPAVTPLPAERDYPASVLGDQDTPEVDRSTPRRGFDVPLLLGALTHGQPLSPAQRHCESCYNSAVLLDKHGEVLALHDKAFLLAFGEYMPLGDRFPKLYDLSPETSRFEPGTRTAPLELALDGGRKLRAGMLICYEDLLPSYARRVAVHNPNVLVNLTNDAWFGKTAEPEHHLNLALMRSVEYRRWLLRSTNTGISVYIDAVGRRVAQTRLDDAETLLRAVPLLEGETIYARLGDWPLLGLALLCGLLLLQGLRGGGQPGSGGAKAASKARRKPKPAKG